jgi:drug/metabolite transporter (DMT)-like permease
LTIAVFVCARSATFARVSSSWSPVVAIAVDCIAFGQRLAALQILGAMLILLAAAGVNLGWAIVPRRRVSSS